MRSLHNVDSPKHLDIRSGKFGEFFVYDSFSKLFEAWRFLVMPNGLNLLVSKSIPSIMNKCAGMMGVLVNLCYAMHEVWRRWSRSKVTPGSMIEREFRHRSPRKLNLTGEEKNRKCKHVILDAEVCCVKVGLTADSKMLENTWMRPQRQRSEASIGWIKSTTYFTIWNQHF